MKAFCFFHRFGPYHVARLAAAGERGEVVGVELAAETAVYAWDKVEAAGFRRLTLCPDTDGVSKRELARLLTAALDRERPGVVFVPGWGGSAQVAALRWCLATATPAVVMSESSAADGPAHPVKRWVKRQIAGRFGAALVGGTWHAEYAVSLGLPADKVFVGYDVVDNAHFAAGAAAARSDPDARNRLGLPRRYVLASNRFLAKKNLPVMLDGFARYRAAHPDGWHLVLLGDGESRPELEKQVNELGLTGRVHLPGFKQYAELPAYYGLADAFVHTATVEPWGLVVNEALAAGLPAVVSDRCGCSPDLVTNGANGFTFPPDQPGRLAELLGQLWADPAARHRMGEAAERVAAEWAPARFADGFWKAAAAAEPRRGHPVGRVVLAAAQRALPAF